MFCNSLLVFQPVYLGSMDLTVRTHAAVNVAVVSATITLVTASGAQIKPGATLVRHPAAPTVPTSSVMHLMEAVHRAVSLGPMVLCVINFVLHNAPRLLVIVTVVVALVVRGDFMDPHVTHPVMIPA